MTKDEAFTKATGLSKRQREAFRQRMKVLFDKRNKEKDPVKKEAIEKKILKLSGF